MIEHSNTSLFKFIDNLFFNIYSYSPPDDIMDFINKYTTLFICKVFYEKPNFIIYSQDAGIEFKSFTHSIQFTKHSFLPFGFKKGFLELENLETDDIKTTQEFKILIDFDFKKQALQVFDFLCENLSSLTNSKKQEVIGGVTMIEFETFGAGQLSGVSMFFAKNNFSRGYRIVIYPRAALIHFPQK